MTTAVRTSAVFAAIVIVAALSLLFVPHRAHAVGLDADMQCVPAIPVCGCGQVQGPNGCTGGNNKYMCPCTDTTNGFGTQGLCQANQKCKATGTSGPNGFGLQMVQQILGSLMQKLMQGGGGGSGGGSGSSGSTPAAGSTGCTSYYQVTTPSTDPCAYYVAPVSSQLGNTNNTGSNSSNVSDQLNSLTNTNTNTNTNANTGASEALNQLTAQVTTVVSSTSAPATALPVIVPQGVIGGLISGVSGDIQTLGNGGTILAGSVDTNNNSVTAGFFGSDTLTGQPTGVIANLCQSRPWASNFLSYVLPPSFFDSLCALRGYQVGKPQPVAPAVTVVQSAPRPVTTAPAASTTPAVTPKVSIWAVPASVPLGSRTSVFWSSQGVTNCTETSPDGSFSQNSLSGGASTVALTGATTFTISCITPDGSHVTGYVTVNLSI